MNIELTARHLDLTPAIRTFAEEKLTKLGRLIDDLDIHVTLATEKHRQSCVIVARGKGVTVTGEVEDDDLYTAIHAAVDNLARQLRKNKTSRLADRREGAPTIRKPASPTTNGERKRGS